MPSIPTVERHFTDICDPVGQVLKRQGVFNSDVSLASASVI